MDLRRKDNEMMGIFQKLAHSGNRTVIVVTHSKEMAAHADVVLRLQDGQIQEEN